MTLELDAHGFPKTSGIFETIKTVNGQPIALARHMRRALDSARSLGIKMPPEEELRIQLVKLLNEKPFEIGKLRICIYADDYHLSHDGYTEPTNPLRFTFFSQTVTGEEHKQFPYDHRFALLKSAQDEGFDDCILFNVKNEVTESAVANLLFLIEGVWVTPPISAGVLPGVIRAIAIEECEVKVRPIHISEIGDVESAFSLASLRIAQPISHIGEMKLKIGDASQDMEARIRSHTQPHSVG
uniref:aminotransferase class IV n=1 Tax=Candidatus Planktophila sp. TaxID=2175601 RepID=UPI00404A53D0